MLLFVCHANICRSPMAERLARLALTQNASASNASASNVAASNMAASNMAASNIDVFTIASAGTHARAGDPMHPGAEQVLRELGADTTGFRSRPVSADLVARASLVLTATRNQRAFCVRLAPVALRRTFTIRQFGRLAAAVQEATIETEATTADTAAETNTAHATTADTTTAGTTITNTAITDTAGHAPGTAGTFSAARMAMLLQRVANVRERVQPVDPDEDDLADPINGTETDMRACAHQIQLSLRPALALISV